MTQYLLSLPHDSADEPTMATMDPTELERVMGIAMAFMEELTTSDVFVLAGGLEPPSAAVTVDHTGDALALTDGPFVEAKEYLGGFWVIDVPDQETAVAWAAKASKALGGRIEVRAFQTPPEE